MNQQLWSGLTAALIIGTLGVTTSSGHADQSIPTDDVLEADVSVEHDLPESIASNASVAGPPEPADSQLDVVKVGEHQSQDDDTVAETVATIHPHEMGGRQAATLYVHNIPVLTFLGTSDSDPNQEPARASSLPASTEVKVASTQNGPSAEPGVSQTVASATPNPAADDYSSDPVWRATTIAAKLNQLYRDNVDASSITANWDAERERYVVKVDGEELVEINSDTILPDTTSDLAEDALQVTNRLRRQMGNAAPLREIAGRPQPAPPQVSLGAIEFTIRGIASWYGPGFHGNRSASGEVFNQNALTAAHRNLPFGTQVRVTNLNNGRSVVVRINDRGPYSGRRVIDLSAAAARAVGLVQSGVAPVSIDVLGAAQTASSNVNP